jgi:cell division protein FtsL
MKRVPTQQPNFIIRRERDTRTFSRLLILLLCGLVLSGGFIYAAKLRFKAVTYGYKNEQLRKERERLLEEQRRLRLEHESAVSPVNLQSAAHRIGMKSASPGQIVSAKPRIAKEQKQRVEKRKK